MRKVICAGLMIAGLFVNKSFAQGQQGQQLNQNPQQEQQQDDQKVQLPPGSWIVVEPRQYTIDQSCRVMSTGDGITWAVSPTNSWMDLDGSWYHIEDKQLYRSVDGKTWEPVQDNRWQDVLGNQLMLTSDCSVVTGNAEGLNMKSNGAQPIQIDREAIAADKKTYGDKMSKRITELEAEVKQLKKDSKRHPENVQEVQARESRLSQLKQGLANISTTADEEWEGFKKSMDALF